MSPAYDLTFSSGPAGEHSTMIMGEGKTPTKKHLVKLAATCNIKKENALEIINQVLRAVQKWQELAAKTDVSKLRTQNIKKALIAVHKNFGM